MFTLFHDSSGQTEFLIHNGPLDGKKISYLVDEGTDMRYSFFPQDTSIEKAKEEFAKELSR